MSLIITSRTRAVGNRAPTRPPVYRPISPYAAVAAPFYSGANINLASGAQFTTVGTEVTNSVGNFGRGFYRGSGLGGDRLEIDPFGAGEPLTGCCISFWMTHYSNPVTYPFLFNINDQSSSDRISAHVGFSGSASGYYFDYGSTSSGRINGSTGAVSNRTYHYVLWASGNNTAPHDSVGMGIMMNGEIIKTSAANDYLTTTTATTLSIGADLAGGGEANVRLYDFQWYTAAHDQGFRDALWDPETRWDMYGAHRGRTYFLPPAATTDSVFITTSRTPVRPYRVTGINYSSPLSRGLVDAVDFLHGVGVSHAGKEVLVNTGGAHSQAAKWGHGVEVEGSESVPFTHKTSNFDDGCSVTVLLQYTGTGYGSGSRVFWDETSGGPFAGRGTSSNNELTFELDFRSVTTSGAPSIYDNVPHTVTMRSQGKAATADYRIDIDGKNYHDSQPGSQGSIDVGTSINIGNSAATNRASGMSFGFFLIHDRFLSDYEVQQLHSSATQWQWAQQAPRRTYFMPSGFAITLGAPKSVSDGGTAATIGSITSDTAGGTLYWIVQPDGTTDAPTSTEIKAGQNGDGDEATHSGTIPP